MRHRQYCDKMHHASFIASIVIVCEQMSFWYTGLYIKMNIDFKITAFFTPVESSMGV